MSEIMSYWTWHTTRAERGKASAEDYAAYVNAELKAEVERLRRENRILQAKLDKAVEQRDVLTHILNIRDIEDEDERNGYIQRDIEDANGELIKAAEEASKDVCCPICGQKSCLCWNIEAALAAEEASRG